MSNLSLWLRRVENKQKTFIEWNDDIVLQKLDFTITYMICVCQIVLFENNYRLCKIIMYRLKILKPKKFIVFYVVYVIFGRLKWNAPIKQEKHTILYPRTK